MIFLVNALKIIFVLSFLVLIHEGGHFLVAKLFKVHVNEFSIGFGKELISKQGKETKYVIRMIPFGGYVSMLGEEQRSDDEGSFSKKSILKRIAIVAAGGLVNIVFGLLVYFILVASLANNFYSNKIEKIDETSNLYNTEIQADDEIIKINNKRVHTAVDVEEIVQQSNGKSINIEIKRKNEKREISVKPNEQKDKTIGIYLDGSNEPKIEYIYDGYPADKAGIEVGDIIKEINGIKIENHAQVSEQVDNSTEKITVLVKKKNGTEKEYKITPKEISIYDLGITYKKDDKSFKNRMYYGFWRTVYFNKTFLGNIKEIFTGKISAKQLSGPVGISRSVAKTSTISEFVYLLAMISLSLGITNLLPFPALDGGRILILLIEAIRRKPLNEKTEIAIQMIGFSLLILLSIYVSYNDILRIF